MVTRPRMPRTTRPVSHNQQQSRVGPGMAGMAGQRVVPQAGPRNQAKYRPAVNQSSTTAQPSNASATAGIAVPVSKLLTFCIVSRF